MMRLGVFFQKGLCWLFTISMLSFSVSAAAAPPNGVVYSSNLKATKKIALTFDDGPHPRYTERILKILQQYHVTATFFTIGVNVKRYPEAFQKILESDCEIGNHTYSHHNVNTMNQEEIRTELRACERAIVQCGGKKTPSVFRPPQGMLNSTATTTAAALGYSVVLWSIDTRDWEHTPPQAICNNVLKSLKGGDIILMHDYISGTNTTCEALTILIPELLRRGYEFVTVSQLIKEDTATSRYPLCDLIFMLPAIHPLKHPHQPHRQQAPLFDREQSYIDRSWGMRRRFP